jgi:pyruvate ferredoxin oxidoreductase alpha subunit
MDDAEVAEVVMSSTAGTTKAVVDELRKQNIKAGLLRPRFFRPFPKDRIIKSLSKVKAAAVLDRAESFSGCGGPLYNDVKSAMYESKQKPVLINRIFGLGGREIFKEDISTVYKELLDIIKSGKTASPIDYIGARE